MINPKSSLIPAKSLQILLPQLIKFQIVKKVYPLKVLKHFYKIASLSFHIALSYQGENANKALFIDFDRRAIINQS